MSAALDLNADVGEGFGRWDFGADRELLALISSANVACGMHAGDATVMRKTLHHAKLQGCVVGAHVSYPDRQGFGRRRMDIASGELADLVIFQLATLKGVAEVEGAEVRYVKPHGALYNTVVHDPHQARAVIDAVVAFDSSLAVLGLPGSALLTLAAGAGLRTITEAFADRAYLGDGTLAPRSMSGSVLHDPRQITHRVLQMVSDGTVIAIDGSVLPLRPDSVCLHGDSPGAAVAAARVAEGLIVHGVEIRSALAI